MRSDLTSGRELSEQLADCQGDHIDRVSTHELTQRTRSHSEGTNVLVRKISKNTKAVVALFIALTILRTVNRTYAMTAGHRVGGQYEKAERCHRTAHAVANSPSCHQAYHNNGEQVVDSVTRRSPKCHC